MAKDKSSVVVIQNFVTARPPQRTQFDIGDWRSALTHAEMQGGNRVKLYDLYDDVMLDPHLSAQWEKRVNNIINTDVLFTNNEKEVDEMRDLTESPEFEELLQEIMNQVAWGITLLELGNKKVSEFGKELLRLTLYCVDRKHIRPKEGIITKEQYDSNTSGIRYREGAFANYVAEIGKPDDLGLILKAAPYVLLKKGAVGDWALFVQLFGQPFREYRYDGYDDKVRIQLEQSAKDMGSAPYIILPDGAQLTLHDIKTNTGGEVHSKLANFCDEQISVLILGNTETTKSSKSSGYAQAETHMKTQRDVFVADKKRVRRVLNRVIKPILFNLGFPVKDGHFHFKEEIDIAQRLSKINLIKMVKSVGAPIDDDTIYQESGLPKPENYDELKEEMRQMQQQQFNENDADEEDEEDDENDEQKEKQKSKTSAAKKKAKQEKKDTKLSSLLYDFRLMLADFFDPPRK
jgi:phage gp29-like protein